VAKQKSKKSKQAQTTTVPLPSAPLAVEPLPAIKPPSELLGPGVLVPLLCSCIVLGSMLYHVPGLAVPQGNELSWPQPLFTAINAATLTGFQQARNPNDYRPAGQAITLCLTIAGILFSFICGGVAILRIARMRFKDWQLIGWAFGAVAIVSIFGGVLMIGQGRSFGQGAFQAISAFGNSGLYVGRLPVAGSFAAMGVLLPLAVLGGLGLPALMELWDAVVGRAKLSQHSRVVLSWSAGVYLALFVVLILLQTPAPFGDAKPILVSAAEQSLNSRSAGFAFEYASALPQAITFVLVLSMIIGASPGGTGGGMKVTALAVVADGTRSVLKGNPPGRRFAVAILWMAIYLGLLAIVTVALLMTDPEIHLDRTLFLAASALGNVGLSHNPIDASSNGIYVLCAAMLVGRVAPVLMLWYVIDTTPDANVAVG
jgi:Trk-type K+ transport system membrane component